MNDGKGEANLRKLLSKLLTLPVFSNVGEINCPFEKDEAILILIALAVCGSVVLRLQASPMQVPYEQLRWV